MLPIAEIINANWNNYTFDLDKARNEVKELMTDTGIEYSDIEINCIVRDFLKQFLDKRCTENDFECSDFIEYAREVKRIDECL